MFRTYDGFEVYDNPVEIGRLSGVDNLLTLKAAVSDSAVVKLSRATIFIYKELKKMNKEVIFMYVWYPYSCLALEEVNCWTY